MRRTGPEPFHRLRSIARKIFDAALKAAEPGRLVARLLAVDGRTVLVDSVPFSLGREGRVFLLAAGKAASPMSDAAAAVLGPLVSDGLTVVRDDSGERSGPIPVMVAGHPVPDAASLSAAGRMLDLARSAGPGDLVLCLFSGGASALLSAPAPHLELEHLCRTTGLLIHSGTAIDEINCVRKHLSAIKGGQLARAARPARVATLLLSDVVNDRPEVIASGPTVADPGTFAQALEVLEHHGLLDQVPGPVALRLRDGAAGRLPETPGADDPCFHGSLVRVAGSSREALHGAAAEAKRLGCRVEVRPEPLVGEAGQAAARICAEAFSADPPDGDALSCRLSAGETTVTLPRDHGLGGRNMELALAAVPLLAERPGSLLLSAGTDGSDGPTSAAGAIVDSSSLARSRAAGFDHIEALLIHDSFPFFEALDDLLVTGPTQTNVLDLQILIRPPSIGKSTVT
jgi:glycerate 2-kinase